MRLSLLFATALAAFAFQAATAAQSIPVLDVSSKVLTPALQLEEMMEPVHGIRLVVPADEKGLGRGVLELDPNVPMFDELGNVKKGDPKPPLKLQCTLKLVKAVGDQQLYEIKGPKITSRLFLATGGIDAYSSRLLVHGKDSKVKHVVGLVSNVVERPVPPCHPGCFPAGTAVRVPEGVMPIERVHKGDLVTTVGVDGEASSKKVLDVFVTRNTLVQVRTADDILMTTQTQPLCLAEGGFRLAGELKTGDRIWQWQSGKRQAVEVVEVSPTKRESQVFNLVLGDSIVFIAGDFLARSKPPAEAVSTVKR